VSERGRSSNQQQPTAHSRAELHFLEQLCGAGGHRTSRALAAILGANWDQVEWSAAGLVETAALSAALGPETDRAIGVQFKLDGHLPGQLSMLLSETSACALVERLLGPRTALGSAGDFAPEAASALAEVANIVTAAFLTPVADLLQRSCVPSPPTLIHHRWPHVVRDLKLGDGALVLGVALAARSQPPTPPIAARILFAPNGFLLEDLLAAARAGAG
jgi:chemotaxis protein CheY-P-specific phosphatase CheC